MQTRAVFLDASGVLLDPAAIAAQWQAAVAEHLAARFGGASETWQAANAHAFTLWLARIQEAQRKAGPRRGSRDAHIAARTRWLVDVCEQAAVAAPADPATVAEEVQRECARRVRAPLRDAVAAVEALRRAGYTLYTSSGLPSWELAAYLEALGLTAQFARMYGCDLVDRWKSGPHYYRAIAEDVGVDPRRAVCVDDTPIVLDWAKKAGMRTFLLGGQGGGQRHERIASLTELEPLI